jgi:phenylacetate-CoA ligase
MPIRSISRCSSAVPYLGETAQKEGIDPRRNLAVKRIFVAGEPGGSIPETRNRIEDLWGAKVYDYYGLSDIFGACAGMCEQRNGLHWAEGERGEMVLTTLKKQARPLIRFRTGDIVSFTSKPSTCGRTSQRLLGVHGRLDDMLIIKGVNIFPSDVEAVVRKDSRLSGEYRLVVERRNHLDHLTVEAEQKAGDNHAPAELAHDLGRQVKAVTGIHPEISILAAETLPRATHKAKTQKARQNDPKILKYIALYRSPEVKDFINKRFDGTIIPTW